MFLKRKWVLSSAHAILPLMEVIMGLIELLPRYYKVGSSGLRFLRMPRHLSLHVTVVNGLDL